MWVGGQSGGFTDKEKKVEVNSTVDNKAVEVVEKKGMAQMEFIDECWWGAR